MRILFDQGTPVPLRRLLEKHQVATAFEMGWSNLQNGELLKAAEEQFDLFVTTDQNLKYQQNLANRQIAILVLVTSSWPKLRTRSADVVLAIDRIMRGEYHEFV